MSALARKTGPLSVLIEKHFLLWTGLFGIAICLLLNQAPETFMVILQIGVIVNFVKDRRLIREIDVELVFPLCIILLPLVLNLLHPDELTKDQYARGLVWSLFLITSCWIIAGKQIRNEARWLLTATIVVLCLFFLIQTGAFLLKNHRREIFPLLQGHVSKPHLKALQEYILKTRFAIFSNIHYFSLFAVITLPVSLFCIWKIRRPFLKGLMSLCALCGAYLLLNTGSRPGWLALISAGLAVVPFARGKTRFFLLGVLFFIPLVLYSGDILGFKTRINGLLFNLAKEERVTLWSDAWEMQKASDWQGWLIGHGLGSFFHYFKTYSHLKSQFVFPHNFFLEILFNSGVITLMTVIAGYASFYYALITLWFKTMDQGHKQLAVLLISVMTAHFVHTFLTLPFLTGRAILSLAIIVGAAIWLLRQEKHYARELSPAYDHNSQL